MGSAQSTSWKNFMILHDFVGFRVRFENLIFLIKAEKSTIGISVTQPLRWGRDVVPRYVCENLEDCGEIRMEDLLAILKERSPDYHLLSDNCWSYADATFKQVIRKFSETPSLSPERRSYLASFLNNTSPVMPDEVLRSVRTAAVRAAVVAPTTLPAQVAGFPITPADVQNGLNTFTAAQAYAPQVLRALQAYRGGVHTQAGLASLITRAFRYLVSLPAFIIKWAVWVAPYLAAGVAGGLIAYALGTLFIFIIVDATSLGQSLERWWRSLFSTRLLNQAQGLPAM
ncbi:unnamed protein product [Sphagnum jensenii]